MGIYSDFTISSLWFIWNSFCPLHKHCLPITETCPLPMFYSTLQFYVDCFAILTPFLPRTQQIPNLFCLSKFLSKIMNLGTNFPGTWQNLEPSLRRLLVSWAGPGSSHWRDVLFPPLIEPGCCCSAAWTHLAPGPGPAQAWSHYLGHQQICHITSMLASITCYKYGLKMS